MLYQFAHCDLVEDPHTWISSVCSPSEEHELTANSLGALIETHSGLILRTLHYLTVNSQDDSHCELSKSLQLTK